MRPSGDPLASSAYRWRRFRLRLFNALAAIIIGLAVLVGVARLLVPFADELRPALVDWLSAQTGLDINIERIEVEWPGLTPSIWIRGLSIGEEQAQPLGLDSALIEFRLINLFRPQSVTTQVVLVDPRLLLTEHSQGQWGFGVKVETEFGQVESDGSLGEVDFSANLPSWVGLSIRQADLVLQPMDAGPIDLHIAEADFSVQGQEYQLTGWLSPSPGAPEQVQFRLWMVRENDEWIGAQAWLEAKEIALDYWLNEAGLVDLITAKTMLTLEAWLKWDQLHGARLDTQWTVAGEDGVLEAQASALRWPIGDSQRAWSIELYQLAFNDDDLIQSLVWTSSDEGQAVAVESANLAGVHRALSPWFSRWSAWPEQLSGEAEDVLLVSDHEYRVHQAQGQLNGLAIEHSASGLTLSGLDLTLGQVGDRLGLGLGGPLSLHWPKIIKGQVALDDITGQVVIDSKRITFDQVILSSPAVELALAGHVYASKQRPFLDLWIEAPRIESIDVRPFLPHAIIPEPAMRWLQNALVYIGSAKGNALLHFPVGLKTADFRPGHFASEVNFSGVEMAYAIGWPTAYQMEGEVSFIGSGLSGSVESARVNDLALQASAVTIERFTDPVLRLQLEGKRVSSEQLADTLAGLPFNGWAETFSVMAWAGPIDAAVTVSLPFGSSKDWSLGGEVRFVDNSLSFPVSGTELTNLSGLMSISNTQLNSRGLQAQLADQAVKIDLRAELGAQPNVVATTQLDAGAWVSEQPWGLGWGDRLDGRSEVSVRVGRTNNQERVSVSVESNFEGTAIDLPPPLAKAADIPWPSNIQWLPVDDGAQWQVVVAGLGAATLQSDSKGWAIAVDGQSDEPPIPPIGGGLELFGEFGNVDVGQWQTLLANDSRPSNAAQHPIDEWIENYLAGTLYANVVVRELLIPAVQPSEAVIDLEWQREQWTINVSSPSIQGELIVPTQRSQGRSVLADLEYLYLLAMEPGSDDVPIRPPKLTDPKQAQPWTVLIESLFWGDLALGTARIQSHRTADGLEIELLDIDGPDLRLQARGRWVQSGETLPRTSMVGRLSSANFNQLIQATGYQAGLQARQAALDFDLNWPGTPLDFNLIRLSGGFDFEVRAGNIPQASAGAGRLLGLMSFNALPRRLILDFRDVFASGFPFDMLSGRFDLADGLARTEGVRINSAVVVIQLSGTTDMIARTYDQSVVVQPGLGSTLPVIGGLAGGPVGAAAGLILQSIFNQPLKGVSEVRYAISGPWSDPLIELVDAKVTSVAPDQPSNEEGQPPPNR